MNHIHHSDSTQVLKYRLSFPPQWVAMTRWHLAWWLPWYHVMAQYSRGWDTRDTRDPTAGCFLPFGESRNRMDHDLDESLPCGKTWRKTRTHVGKTWRKKAISVHHHICFTYCYWYMNPGKFRVKLPHLFWWNPCAKFFRSHSKLRNLASSISPDPGTLSMSPRLILAGVFQENYLQIGGPGGCSTSMLVCVRGISPIWCWSRVFSTPRKSPDAAEIARQRWWIWYRQLQWNFAGPQREMLHSFFLGREIVQGASKETGHDYWLVVWNIFFIFPYVGNNHPNWLIFFRGVQTTNQTIMKWDVHGILMGVYTLVVGDWTWFFNDVGVLWDSHGTVWSSGSLLHSCGIDGPFMYDVWWTSYWTWCFSIATTDH